MPKLWSCWRNIVRWYQQNKKAIMTKSYYNVEINIKQILSTLSGRHQHGGKNDLINYVHALRNWPRNSAKIVLKQYSIANIEKRNTFYFLENC